jgi:predicted Zn-dependent peptidase
VANDWDWPARVAAVTAADVRRVAQRYLNDYAVALIMPED